MPGSYIFLVCPASLGRILSEMKGDRRHSRAVNSNLYVVCWGFTKKMNFPRALTSQNTADVSYQIYILAHLVYLAI